MHWKKRRRTTQLLVKIAAWLVTNTMKLKTNFGMGLEEQQKRRHHQKGRRRQLKQGGKISLKGIIDRVLETTPIICTFANKNEFSFCINLKFLLGFAEDYRRVIVNFR